MTAQRARDDRLLPAAWIIARREFRERVRSRLFAVSTILLASLAVVMALTPIFIRAMDRGTTTTIAISTDDDLLASRSISVMSGVLNASTSGSTSGASADATVAVGPTATDAMVASDPVSTPTVTTPTVTPPALATPGVTTPDVTTPDVTTPAVTTPAVTPAVTTPGLAEPAGGQ